jgi:molybdenum cofactor synthesis domain-containing protein
MPRMGLFARVLAGGAVAVGDPVEIEETVLRSAFQAVVLTLSDRCAADLTQDTAGPAVSALLRESLPAHIYRTEILPDERAPLAERLRHYADGHGIDLIVAVGGTGLSPRDITPEAVRDVIERPTPGFDEAMRAASLAHTKLAMLSRACSGVRGQTLILSLPGSERAAVENLRAILPALPHGLRKLRGDPEDCGRPSP